MIHLTWMRYIPRGTGISIGYLRFNCFFLLYFIVQKRLLEVCYLNYAFWWTFGATLISNGRNLLS